MVTRVEVALGGGGGCKTAVVHSKSSPNIIGVVTLFFMKNGKAFQFPNIYRQSQCTCYLILVHKTIFVR